MPAPTITALPAAPQRTEDAATFATKAEAFVVAMEGMPAEYNALAEFVEEAAGQVDTDATAVAVDRAAAQTARIAAESASDTAVSALNTLALAGRYGTKALADAAVSGIASNAYVGVVADETQGGQSSIYQKVGSALEYVGPATGPTKTFINSTDPAPSPENGHSQITREFVSPSRTAGNPASLKFREVITYSPYAVNDIGSGSPKLTNRVWGIVWNGTNSFTPDDIDEGTPSIRVEAKFAVSSRNPAKAGQWIDGAEFHHAMHTTGEDGIEYRPLSIYAPHDAEDWGHDSSISMQSAIYAFADGYKNIHVSFDWLGAATDPKIISMSNKVRMDIAGNNRVIVTQANAAGSAQVPLPYVNGQDNYQLGAPVYLTCDVPVVNALGIKSLLSMVATAGITDGARVIYVTTNAVTGSATGLDFNDMSCSTRFEGLRVRNTHATGSSGIRIQGNGATYLDFFNEANFHRWGLRLKTNGDFTIGQTEQGGDIADALRINFTTLQTTFLKAPKLPVDTVAGAGSAATAGAGALHYVTDLNATTLRIVAVGGGTYDGVVVSDGTDWRVMCVW